MLFNCFGITFPSQNLLGELDSPAGPSAGEFIRWLNEDADETFPEEGWRMLAETGNAALYGARAEEGSESPAFVVTIRETRGTWQAEDYGACTPSVHLEPDLGPATWEPAGEIDASTTEFEALVTEIECASAQSSEGRVVEPRITVEDDAITIIFNVTPLEGDQDCPTNPPSRYRIVLPEPLGDRELRDGSYYPGPSSTRSPLRAPSRPRS